jgi:hypothetical protein
MIVPRYWAEGREQHREQGKQTTLRRFGWSNTSQADAQSLADVRAKEALQRVLSGEKLERREPKTAYNGADGVPIREEIISEHGDVVITRNGYGARCLNTPNVFFADIDFEPQRSPSGYGGSIFCVLWLGSTAVAWMMDLLTGPIAFGLFVATTLLTVFIASAISGRRQAALDAAPLAPNSPEALARGRIQAFLKTNFEWSFRLYRTPAGLRLMATHALVLPQDPAVAEALQALGTDPIYTAMCLKQQCFRARLTAKPWRIGVHTHMRPRPGVWPVAEQYLPKRQAWVQGYEKAAAGFAACRYIETLGSTMVHRDVVAVQELHDAQCQATSELKLA